MKKKEVIKLDINEALHVSKVYKSFKKDLKKKEVIGYHIDAVSLRALMIIVNYKETGRFPLTIRDLRDELGDDAQYASNAITCLRSEGLVDKKRESHDERIVYILMNDEQHQQSKKVIEASQKRFDAIWEEHKHG